jgi:hypothetical protein
MPIISWQSILIVLISTEKGQLWAATTIKGSFHVPSSLCQALFALLTLVLVFFVSML